MSANKRHFLMMKSWCDKSAERPTKWYALEFCMSELEDKLTFLSILVFFVMVLMAFFGFPSNSPTVFIYCVWVMLIVAAFKASWGTLKRVYLRKPQIFDGTGLVRPLKPPKAEFFITVGVSVACVASAIILNLYSRNFLLLLPLKIDIDYQRFVMVWVYWVFKFFLMHMYGVFSGVFAIVLLFTGCFCGFCCNCFCRGPFFAFLRRGKTRAKGLRKKKPQPPADATGDAIVASASGAASHKEDGGEINHGVVREYILSDEFAPLEVLDPKPSKDGPEPIIDFVENKAQVGTLTPLIFVFAFAVASTLVMCGSALIGPEKTLPLAASRPAVINALCRGSVTGLVADAMAERVGPKLSFFGIHLVWDALLEPPVDGCEDIVHTRQRVALASSTLFYDLTVSCVTSGFVSNSYGIGCDILFNTTAFQRDPSDMTPFEALALYVPEEERAARWEVAAALPWSEAGSGEAAPDPPLPAVVTVPPLTMVVNDENVIGARGVNVTARVFSYSGTCASGGSPMLLGGITNLTDAVGVLTLSPVLDATGCTAGNLILEIYLPDVPLAARPHTRVYRYGLVASSTLRVSRYANVRLYSSDPSSTYASHTATYATQLVNNFTEVGVRTEIDINSTVLVRNQYTWMNTTTYSFLDEARTVLDNSTSVITEQSESAVPGIILVLSSQLPSNATMRQPIGMTVQVLTEHGIPVPGSPVSALLLAPKGTNAKVVGTMRAHTDSAGVATFSMRFEAGRSGNYTFLVASEAVIAALQRPNGLTSLVNDRATELQNTVLSSFTQAAQSQLGQQANDLQQTVVATLQGQLQATVQQQSQEASQQAAQAASQCVANQASAYTSNPTAALSTLAGGSTAAQQQSAALQACVQTGITGALSGLTASVTQTLQSSVNNLAQPGGAFGIDATTISAQLEPLLQQSVLTALNQIPGLSQLSSNTSLPRTSAELLDAAQDVAIAVWSLLPLPAPQVITLINGLDQPGVGPTHPWTSVAPLNGANLTAPLVGYGLAETSESTSAASGMSSCVLEGYARVEPSPRGTSFLLALGLLSPPADVLPSWTSVRGGDRDATAALWGSALWQPFPFNNFNFLFDNEENFLNTPDVKNVDACKHSYVSKQSTFPLFFDSGFDIWMGEGTSSYPCQGAGMKCTANVPDRSGFWEASEGSNLLFEARGQSKEEGKCIKEYVRMFGGDPMPSHHMSVYGGMQVLGNHLECLGCFESIMTKVPGSGAPSGRDECGTGIVNVQTVPDSKTNPNWLADTTSSFNFMLTQEFCDLYFCLSGKEGTAGAEDEKCIAVQLQNMGSVRPGGFTVRPDISLGDVFAWNFEDANFQLAYPGWANATAIKRLQDLTGGSYWNGCYSQRYRKQEVGNRPNQTVNPNRVSRFKPEATLDIQVFGAPVPVDEYNVIDLSVFGGSPPVVTMRDTNPDGVWEWIPLKMSALLYLWGGSWYLFQTQVVEGGSKRALSIEILLDGVPVGNTTDSWWKFDNHIHYVNPDTLEFSKVGLLYLTGHDGFRVFALLTIPVFYLNVRGRSKRMPGILGVAVGLAVVWLMIYYFGAILRSAQNDPENMPPMFDWTHTPFSLRFTSMLAFGRNDLVALSSLSSMGPMQTTAISFLILFIVLPFIFNFWYLTLRWLCGEFLYPWYPKRMQRLRDRFMKSAAVLRTHASAFKANGGEGEVALAPTAADAKGWSNEQRVRQAIQAAVFNGDLSPLWADKTTAFNGMPEPAAWFEADLVKRHRCARNHLRILLRGRAWYEHQLVSAKDTKAAKKAAKAAAKAAKKSAKVHDEPADASAPMGDGDELATIVPEKAKVVKLVANRRKPLEGKESFFFPMRLRMACWLSCWICLMLTLIYLNIGLWAVNVIGSAGNLDDAIGTHALYSDQMQYVTRYGTNPTILFAIIAESARALGGDLSGTSAYIDLVKVFVGVGGFVLSITWLVQWYYIYQNFKDDTYALRRGFYFFDVVKFREEFANKYIGYQVAHMSVSFIIITVLYTIVTAILAPVLLSGVGIPNHDLFVTVLRTVGNLLVPFSVDRLGVIVPLFGSLIFQQVMNRQVFFDGDGRNAWLRYPFWYGLFDYNLIYTNALIGITICIARLATLFIFFIFFIARLDKTTMPGPRGGWLNTDPAYKSYIGMLRLDHRYNNPLFLVWGDIMLECLRLSRVKVVLRNARRTYLKHNFGLREEAAAKAGKTPEELRKLARRHKLILWAHRIVEFARDRYRARAIVIRNRWQLTWRMMQQPYLMNWRQDARRRDALKQAALQSGIGKSASAAAAVTSASPPAEIELDTNDRGRFIAEQTARLETVQLKNVELLSKAEKAELKNAELLAELDALKTKVAALDTA